MSRTDVLFQMTQIIRSRKFTTAKYLSDRLSISIRTVYRYINDLSLAGIPVISQTGKGYWIDKSFDMPPIQLSEDELLALSLGSRLVKAVADSFLADAAQQLIDKVESVIPETHQQLLYQSTMHTPMATLDETTAYNLGLARNAVNEKQKIQIDYVDEKENSSSRILWPLALAFWGRSWTLAAWCETRNDFRAFRVDRVKTLDVLKDRFPNEPGRTLEDFIALQQPP